MLAERILIHRLNARLLALPCLTDMSFKLFIIPWLLHAVKYVTSQAPSAPTPNEMLYMNQNAFYDFLQRQHQYNNAILMNNALLTNTMTASAHQASQLQPGLIFHPSFGTLSNQIPSQFPTSNQQFNLLNPAQLGIANGAASAPLYEAYSAGVKTQSFETGANQKLEAIKTESDEADSRDSPISSTPASATTYSTSQILITSTSKTTTSTPIEEKLKVDDSNQENTDKSGSESDLYGLLRNINLTENEKANLVQYVHEIVKEELAKKFSQKVSAPSPPEESVNSPSSDYNEVSAEDSEDMPTTFSVSYEAVTVPSRSDLPEIKLHPPKHTIDKDLVIQTHPIKTSEKHILVAEKLAEDETTDKLRQFSEELPARRDDSDNDLLELETGAPLDLEEAESVTQPLPYRSRKAKSEKTTPSTPTTRSMIQTQPIPRTRALPHQETMFDKLAKDYQERLSGTGDISKMLKTFYDNAYIQLIASESRNQQRQRKVQRKAVARHLIGRH